MNPKIFANPPSNVAGSNAMSERDRRLKQREEERRNRLGQDRTGMAAVSSGPASFGEANGVPGNRPSNQVFAGNPVNVAPPVLADQAAFVQHGHDVHAKVPEVQREVKFQAEVVQTFPIQSSLQKGGLSENQFADSEHQKVIQSKETFNQEASHQTPTMDKRSYADELRQQIAEKEQAKKQQRDGQNKDQATQGGEVPGAEGRRVRGLMSKEDYANELRQQMAEREAARRKERQHGTDASDLNGPQGNTKDIKQRAQQEYYEALKRDEAEAAAKRNSAFLGRQAGPGFDGANEVGFGGHDPSRREKTTKQQYAEQLQEQIRYKQQSKVPAQDFPQAHPGSLLERFGEADLTGHYHEPVGYGAARHMHQAPNVLDAKAQREKDKQRAYAQELEAQIKAKQDKEKREAELRRNENALPWQQPTQANQQAMYPPSNQVQGYQQPGFQPAPAFPMVHPNQRRASDFDYQQPYFQNAVPEAYNQNPYMNQQPMQQQRAPGFSDFPSPNAPYYQPQQLYQGDFQAQEGAGGPGRGRRGQGLSSITGNAQNPDHVLAQRQQMEALERQIAEKEARIKKEREEQEENERKEEQRLALEQIEIQRRFKEEQEKVQQEEQRKAELARQIEERNRLKKEQEEKEKEQERKLQEKIEKEQRELQERYERELEAEERHKKIAMGQPIQNIDPISPKAAPAKAYRLDNHAAPQHNLKYLDQASPLPTSFEDQALTKEPILSSKLSFPQEQPALGAHKKAHLFGPATTREEEQGDRFSQKSFPKVDAEAPKGLNAFARLGLAGPPTPIQGLPSPGKISKRREATHGLETPPTRQKEIWQQPTGNDNSTPAELELMKRELEQQRELMQKIKKKADEAEREAQRLRKEQKGFVDELQNLKSKLVHKTPRIRRQEAITNRQLRPSSGTFTEPTYKDEFCRTQSAPSQSNRTESPGGIWHIPSLTEAEDDTENYLFRAASEIERALQSAQSDSRPASRLPPRTARHSRRGVSPQFDAAGDDALGNLQKELAHPTPTGPPRKLKQRPHTEKDSELNSSMRSLAESLTAESRLVYPDGSAICIVTTERNQSRNGLRSAYPPSQPPEINSDNAVNSMGKQDTDQSGRESKKKRGAFLKAAGEKITDSNISPLEMLRKRAKESMGDDGGTDSGEQESAHFSGGGGVKDSFDVEEILRKNAQKLKLIDELERKCEFEIPVDELSALLACHSKRPGFSGKNMCESDVSVIANFEDSSDGSVSNLTGNTRWVQRVRDL